jgi:predicted permease
MISADLWKRPFGSDPHVVGKTIDLNLTPHTIFGVLPTGFAFPFPGADVWVTRPSEWSWIPSRNWDLVTDLFGFARLRPNATSEQARAELAVLNQQYAMGHPAEAKAEVRVAWLKDYLVGDVQPLLWTLFGAVSFVLLIVCANVASLMLARATARSREFALRAALGAARSRLIRQLLSESIVLAAAGGTSGLLLARWGLTAIASGIALNGSDWAGKQLLPRAGAIRMDGLVLGFTLVVSVATALLFGLFPALRASRPDLAEALRESGAGASAGSSGRAGLLGIGVRGLLVVGQVALSIILVIGAALMIDSFVRLRSVDPGFKSADLLTVKIALPPLRYGSDQKKIAFFEELAESVRAAQGVRDAAVAMSLPTTGGVEVNVQVEGEPLVSPRDQPSAQLQSITPAYFQTLGIALHRGRAFSVRDNVRGAPPVVVINESFARRFWPDYPGGLNPVGQHIAERADRVDSAEIVGVVADVRERGLAVGAKPEFYVPSVVHPPQTAYLAIRTDGDPRRLVNTVRTLVRAIDADQAISDIRTMDDVINASVGQKRLTLVLLGLFAGVALMLAMVGIYGLVTYSVEERTREFAIRRALGAEARDILRVVLRRTRSVAGGRGAWHRWRARAEPSDGRAAIPAQRDESDHLLWCRCALHRRCVNCQLHPGPAGQSRRSHGVSKKLLDDAIRYDTHLPCA